MLPVTPKTVVPLQRMGAGYCSLLLDGICFCGLGLKGAGCSNTALVQLPLCRVLVVFTVVSNGPGPDITNTSYVAAKVTFIAQGFVLVKVTNTSYVAAKVTFIAQGFVLVKVVVPTVAV